MKNRKIIAILAIVLIYALVIRIYGLASSPLWLDESISSLASYKIAHSGLPIFDSGIFYSRALIFHYLQGFLILIFGKTDFIVRFASVLFGLATIILAFFIGKEFNKEAGIISSILTAFLALEVVYSRQARFYQAFQFLFFLTIFLLYKSRNNKKYAYAASISLVATVQTQIAGLVLVPFFIYLFYKEHKDVKLFIIPILVGVYFGASFLGLDSGTSLGSAYAQEYTSQIFGYLRAFFIISIIGMPFAYNFNKRMFYLLLIPSILLFTGLFFIKVFALRYVYFLALSIIILISTLVSYIYKQNKLLCVFSILVLLIYPSNIFFHSNYLTVLKPQEINFYESTEPIMDYKSLKESTISLIMSKPLVVLSSPGVEWYIKKPDYIIPFSLNGLDSGYAISNQKDIYTGAEIFDNQVKEFILIEDYFGYLKLSESERSNLDSLKENCKMLEQSNTLIVYSCIN